MPAKRRVPADAQSDEPEHMLQAGLDYARIARLYLLSRNREDLVLYLNLLIDRIEHEMETPPSLQ